MKTNTAGTILVREITDPAEFPESAKVIRRAFRTVADDFGLTRKNSPTNPAFLNVRWLKAKHRDSDSAKFFGLFVGDKQSGFVLAEKASGDFARELNIDISPNTWWLEKLAVVPARRHSGGGATLVGRAIEYTRKQGGDTVILGMMEENTVLKAWYQMLGFKTILTTKFPQLPFTVSFMKRGT